MLKAESGAEESTKKTDLYMKLEKKALLLHSAKDIMVINRILKICVTKKEFWFVLLEFPHFEKLLLTGILYLCYDETALEA